MKESTLSKRKELSFIGVISNENREGTQKWFIRGSLL